MKLEKMDEMDWTGLYDLIGDNPQCGCIEVCSSPSIYWYVVVDAVAIAIYWMDEFFSDYDNVPAWRMEIDPGDQSLASIAAEFTQDNIMSRLKIMKFEKIN